MHAFTYHKPATVKDATIEGSKGDAKFLAGGQSLLAAMKLRLAAPSDLVDLAAIAELRGIKAEGNAVTIGAMTRHAEVVNSADVKAKIPALAALAALIGDRQVRNMGTIGGSVANNDPSADYPAALVGLGATVNTSTRKIPADQFFKGLFETALQAGEIITSVTFPIPKKAAYVKFKQSASRFALVGVFVAQTADGVRVAVTGAGRKGVFRVKAMEDALAKSWSADAVKGVAVPATDLIGDLHASGEYRAHLVGVMAQRAVAAA
ncbi:FAD binding domain-containing protein [Usitatibacter palustris]|uniref:Carbon monoxide dehydrogenase medium chain n=1 Tax=Usitatibacter palustris TaxID=2732487 RepID=A0A6M4H553_9PROT|nr:xanthine dehydrogenase family protein subunit M [Usitatibacter palustris]QJR14781.1 Carbon monoxide dehydrogenase medium chain [Usitatibacter palustris]